MSRYVEITKNGNSYTVNPNANVNGPLTLYTDIPVFTIGDDPDYRENIFIVFDAEGNIISSADKLGDAKWWVDMQSGAGGYRKCYTASPDDYPFENNNNVDVSSSTNCTITYENGNLTIYYDGGYAVNNKPLILGTLKLGEAICYKIAS